MDTSTLVRDLVEDGKDIMEYLSQAGFEVTAAFWLKPGDDDQWRLYFVSPVAERERLNEAYMKLFTLIRSIPKELWLEPRKVRLIGPNDPVAKNVLAVQNSVPGGGTKPIHWGGRLLGDRYVDGLYVYPLPVAAAS